MFSSHFGYTIDTAALDQSLQKLLPDVIADDRKSASFFFVEAGMTLNFLNILLDSQTPRVALNTMGGASAQTIAGAISTGTHGGDFDRQPLADSVRAIYLVGAGGAHHWIEPANPITAPEKIQATFPCIPAENVHSSYLRQFFVGCCWSQ
jgi:FAD/FMN-containing dehydrogenase